MSKYLNLVYEHRCALVARTKYANYQERTIKKIFGVAIAMVEFGANIKYYQIQ